MYHALHVAYCLLGAPGKGDTQENMSSQCRHKVAHTNYLYKRNSKEFVYTCLLLFPFQSVLMQRNFFYISSASLLSSGIILISASRFRSIVPEVGL